MWPPYREFAPDQANRRRRPDRAMTRGGSSGKTATRHTDTTAADLAAFRLLIDNSIDLIVRTDAAGNRTFVSPSVREILGYEPAELMGGNAFDLVHPEDLDRVRHLAASFGPGCPCIGVVFRMRRGDGSYIWIDGRYRHLAEDGGYLAMLRDITVQKRAEAMLAEANVELEAANHLLAGLASKDGLTGLANRRRFDEMLLEEFDRGRRHGLPLGCVLLDVDCFKWFNDRYGHIAGDNCLIRVARAVSGSLRRPGDLAARYGGEEIVVLLPATGVEGAAAIAEQLREAVAALEIPHPDNPHGIATVSAGVSAILASPGAGDPAELVDAADRALYRAKSDGRNRVRRSEPLIAA